MNWYKRSSYSYVEDILNTLMRFYPIVTGHAWSDPKGRQIANLIRVNYDAISKLRNAEYGTEEYQQLINALAGARAGIVRATKRMQDEEGFTGILSDFEETRSGKIGWLVWEREGNLKDKVQVIRETNPPQIKLEGLDLGSSQVAQSVKQYMGDWMSQQTDGVYVRGTREAWNRFLDTSHMWLENHDLLKTKRMQLPSEAEFDPTYQEEKVKKKRKPGEGWSLEITPLNFEDIEGSIPSLQMKKGKVYRGMRLSFDPRDPNLYSIRDFIYYDAGRRDFRFNRQEGYFDIFEKKKVDRESMEKKDSGLEEIRIDNKNLLALSWTKIQKKLQDLGYEGTSYINDLAEKMTGVKPGESYKQRGKGARAKVKSYKVLNSRIEKNSIPQINLSNRLNIPEGYQVSQEEFYSLLEKSYPGAFGESIPETQKKAQKDGINFIVNKNVSVLADQPGSGKCLSSDSFVEINNQVYTMEEAWSLFTKTSSDCEEIWENPTAPAYVNSLSNDNVLVSLPVSQFYRQRYSGKMRKIKTLEGRTISTTFAHKFLTLKGWTNNISIGDIVCIPSKRVRIKRDTICTPDLAELLAWQIAEGYENKRTGEFSIYQWNSKVLSRLKNIYQSLGFGKSNISDQKRMRACSVKYKKFLKSNGYCWGKKSASKKIPDFIMQSDDDCVVRFLRSFFDAEGWIDKGKRSIGTCSASRVLMMQIASLLARFGIPHTFSSKYKRATNSTMKKKKYFFLTIVANGVSIFLDKIGFLYKRKQDVAKLYPKTSNQNRGCKPVHHLLSQISSYGIPYGHLGISNQLYLTGKRLASDNKISEIIESVSKINSGEKQREIIEATGNRWTKSTLRAYNSLPKKCVNRVFNGLKQIKDNDLLYDKIVSIEEIEYDGYIYDLCIEDTRNYIAEDILCHNTPMAVVASDVTRNEGQKILVITPNMLVQENWLDVDDNGQPIAKAPGKFCGHNAEQIAVCKKSEEFIDAVTNPQIIWIVVPMSSFRRRGLESQTLSRSINKASEEGIFSSLIVDEIQTIKNTDTITFTRVAEAVNPYDIPYRIGLTGTPSDNKPEDIYAQLLLLRHPILYADKGIRNAQLDINENGFANQFIGGKDLAKDVNIPKWWRDQSTEEQIEDRRAELWKEKAIKVLEWVKTLDDNRKLLTLDMFASTYLRREKEDIRPDIPPKQRDVVSLKSPEDMTAPESDMNWHNSLLKKLAHKKVPYTTHLARSVLDSDPENKVFIVTKHPEIANEIANSLNAVYGEKISDVVSGDTKEEARSSIAREFKRQDRLGLRAVVYTMKLGMVGLNFDVASTCIFNDMDWNPSNNLQSEYRIHRITSQKPVEIHYMVFDNSYDKEMYDRVQKKDSINGGVVEMIRQANMTTDTEERISIANNFIKYLVDNVLLDVGLSERDQDWFDEQIELLLPSRKHSQMKTPNQPQVASNWYSLCKY